MLKARLVQGSLLKKMVKVTKNVAGEGANFVFSTTGFSLQAINLSEAVMVAIFLPSDAFDSYHCDRTFSVGINLDFLSRIFRVSSDDDIIIIKALHGVDGVTFIFESPRQDEVSEFRILETSIVQEQLLHISEAEYHAILETESHAILKMPSVVFARICRELAYAGDSVTIKITEKAAMFSTKGELGTSTIVCRQNLDVDKPEEAVVIEMNETVSITFSLRLINSFTKRAPLSNTVTISFLTEMPCVVEYKIAETGYARFYLHPRKEY